MPDRHPKCLLGCLLNVGSWNIVLRRWDGNDENDVNDVNEDEYVYIYIYIRTTDDDNDKETQNDRRELNLPYPLI